MNFRYVFWIMILILTLAMTPSYGGTILIIPGQGTESIDVNAGLSAEAIRNKIGKPSSIESVRRARSAKVEYWLNYPGVSYVVGADKILFKVVIFDPNMVVKGKGIRVNDPVSSLENAMGTGQLEKTDEPRYEKRSYKGISFMIDKETARIRMIVIEKGK